jgi:hypothetical protein
MTREGREKDEMKKRRKWDRGEHRAKEEQND